MGMTFPIAMIILLAAGTLMSQPQAVDVFEQRAIVSAQLVLATEGS